MFKPKEHYEKIDNLLARNNTVIFSVLQNLLISLYIFVPMI